VTSKNIPRQFKEVLEQFSARPENRAPAGRPFRSSTTGLLTQSS
jgi:hypothetical protein